MRNCLRLGVALLFALASQPVAAQGRPDSGLERKVTLTFHQAPLESVLRTLQRQYGLRVSYSNTALNLWQPVTLSVQDQPLRTVLNTLLADKNIGYELVGDQVVLHPIRAPKPQPASGPAKSPPDKPTSSRRTTSKTAVATNIPDPPKTRAQPVESSPPANGAAVPAAQPPVAVQDSAAAPAPDSLKPAQPILKAQVSLLGALGSNGLQNRQTVNHLSFNLLGGQAAGVNGFEAAGLYNVDRDSVAGAQVAGLANIVGRHLDGFQGAGLFNVLGGDGKGWQAGGLFNLAAGRVTGAQTAGLFNYAGSANAPADAANPEKVPFKAAPRRATVQAAGLFNVSLNEVRGLQAAGLFNTVRTIHGVQLAGLLNLADSVDGVSIAPLSIVRHGYHRFEVTNTEAWPVSASLKLGGSAGFYTFFAGTYDGFGSGKRRWGLGYGAGTELWAQRRLSVSFDALVLHVNEEQRGWTNALNLQNQLRLLLGFEPLKAGGHWRLVAGPTMSVLVTQRYDSELGQVHSQLSENRQLWLDNGNAVTRVLGWFGYCAGVRF